MVNLSADPRVADAQMRAILFYLTTFGHIDGEFDAREKDFVRDYVTKLVTHRVETGAAKLSEHARTELVRKFTRHFHDVFEEVDEEVTELFSEAVAHNEKQDAFVHAKLKTRCFEIFQSFDRRAQEQLMESIDALLLSDGEAHPAEVKFRGELSDLLEADLDVELLEELPRARVGVSAPTALPLIGEPAPLFAELEEHYSSDPELIRKQVAEDTDLLERTIDMLEAARSRGEGKLRGKNDVRELAGKPEFLDGHVQVCPPARASS